MQSITNPVFLIIDLFCGAGGTTSGFVQAEMEGRGLAKVIACVNHDHKAIQSHWANHPEVKHFEEDIRTLDLTELQLLTEQQKLLYPDAFVILWASLECTNFSKAKGGQPRDPDSRTLADHLPRYIKTLNPDYIQIENVVEFMSWGPLDANGKPVSRKNGQDWLRWRKSIERLGYVDSASNWKELNSANFGAYTSRNRLFGVFPRVGLPVAWPDPTHAKEPSKFSMHGDLQKWKAVKEVLNFSDEGESIFNRKKPLSDKTFERIYQGLIKFVANGDTSFISKYYSGKPSGKNITVEGPAGTVTCVDGQSVQTKFLLKYNSMDVNGKHTPPSVDEPCPTIPAQVRLGLVQPEFIIQRNSGDPKSKIVDVHGPARTLTSTGGNMELVQPDFLAHYYGNGGQLSSIENPAPVIPTKARSALVQPKYFIEKQVGKSQNQSIHEPAGTLMPNDKHRLVEVNPFVMPTNFNNGPKSIDDPAPTITADRHHHYIVNPSHGGHSTSTDALCPVIVARQDKAPLYLIQAHHHGPVAIPVYEYDTEIVVKIKEFMVVFGLVDIKMRMLRVDELLKIQGFPRGYILEGNQSDQKKFIGNSVVPQVVKVWTEAMAMKLMDHLKKKAA